MQYAADSNMFSQIKRHEVLQIAENCWLSLKPGIMHQTENLLTLITAIYLMPFLTFFHRLKTVFEKLIFLFFSSLRNLFAQVLHWVNLQLQKSAEPLDNLVGVWFSFPIICNISFLSNA